MDLLNQFKNQALALLKTAKAIQDGNGNQLIVNDVERILKRHIKGYENLKVITDIAKGRTDVASANTSGMVEWNMTVSAKKRKNVKTTLVAAKEPVKSEDNDSKESLDLKSVHEMKDQEILDRVGGLDGLRDLIKELGFNIHHKRNAENTLADFRAKVSEIHPVLPPDGTIILDDGTVIPPDGTGTGEDGTNEPPNGTTPPASGSEDQE